MRKINVFYRTEPCLEVKDGFGLHRDRNPDSGWNEWRKTTIDLMEEVVLTPELAQILIEDIAHYYGQDSKLFTEVMNKFKLQIFYEA